MCPQGRRAKLGGPRVLEAVHAGHGTMGRLREALFPFLARTPADRARRNRCGPARQFPIGHAKAPPGPAGRGIAGTSVAVAATVGAGPDQAVGLAVLVVEEIGEDRGVEARIIQLEAQIAASLVGLLGPGRPDLGPVDEHPVAGGVLALASGVGNDTDIADLNREGDDFADIFVAGLPEGADGGHDTAP
ncbi:hypothetical protein GDI0093 [Gluconacetobacter diazotrophicus PA1 5]|uniref:Uncharacterized protein n=1 Tax=Gluconacetobacter diazotrophicus (strain ATCC 49037 / DSM 5601 / CCUG 37298 / CIP 103539 / LMG 7603 / PAl5) TaxID=272568 RepID=A9H047_GLUDA|nr:hypothetical protein GDI0093 [Gluconacetobacter diazotrophicus PA1 5]